MDDFESGVFNLEWRVEGNQRGERKKREAFNRWEKERGSKVREIAGGDSWKVKNKLTVKMFS